MSAHEFNVRVVKNRVAALIAEIAVHTGIILWLASPEIDYRYVFILTDELTMSISSLFGSF